MLGNGIMRMPGIMSTMNCDMFYYRTMGEMNYIDRLNAVPDDRIES